MRGIFGSAGSAELDQLEWRIQGLAQLDQCQTLGGEAPAEPDAVPYNVFFRETSGGVSQAQFPAFADIWS